MGFVYEVGDIVTLKKGHPCGSKEWEILRVGADFRLKCKGCGHQICLLYTSPSPRDRQKSRMPSSA